MQVRLNLATHAQLTHRRFLVGAGALGIVAGLIFLGFGWHVLAVRRVDAQIRAQTEENRRKMADLQTQRTDLENFFRRPENARLHDRSAFLNTLIDDRSFNWTQMFMDLERTLPAGVRVVSIEPKHIRNHVEVKLRVGAINDDAKLKFLKALEESKQFSYIELLSEHSPARTEGIDQKVLELNAIYSRS